MELEKERNIHYLHPDFEMETENKEKKPSPLALLAQTCQSIGSGKDCKYPVNRDKSCSPNSTTTTTKRSIKRANSDYLSNSSNSPLIDQVCSPPTKKIKPTEIDTNCNSRVELNHADTSSDIGKEINQSLMNSFMNFLKNSSNNNNNNNNNSQQSYTDKLEFLYFLTNRFMNHETSLNVEKSKDLSNFNITNGYNLKTQKPLEITTKFIDENNHNKNHQINSITNQSQSVSFDKTNSQINQTPTSISTIKYCMYCGKLIPVLPMLLAHIKIDHGSDQFSEMRLQNFNNQPAPSLCDFLTKFNPYHLASQIKSNQSSSSSPVPSFTNYINNWSSLLGYENLIF